MQNMHTVHYKKAKNKSSQVPYLTGFAYISIGASNGSRTRDLVLTKADFENLTAIDTA